MNVAVSRVPVHPVCAESFDAARTRAEALRAERPDWRVLAPRACPCCVGRVALQVELVRLLRWHRPARVLLVLASSAHLRAVRRTLRADPLARAVLLARSILLPRDAALGARELESLPDALAG